MPTVSAHFRSLLATQWDLGQSVIAAHDAYGMGEYTRTVQANSIISKLAVKRLCLSVFFKYSEHLRTSDFPSAAVWSSVKFSGATDNTGMENVGLENVGPNSQG